MLRHLQLFLPLLGWPRATQPLWFGGALQSKRPVFWILIPVLLLPSPHRVGAACSSGRGHVSTCRALGEQARGADPPRRTCFCSGSVPSGPFLPDLPGVWFFDQTPGFLLPTKVALDGAVCPSLV